VPELLTPHSAALNAYVRGGDPRVVELVRAAGELIDEEGIALAEPVAVAPRRDDYALAAGADGGKRSAGAIARGPRSVRVVPPPRADAPRTAPRQSALQVSPPQARWPRSQCRSAPRSSPAPTRRSARRPGCTHCRRPRQVAESRRRAPSRQEPVRDSVRRT
jgi:hypothetical protein